MKELGVSVGRFRRSVPAIVSDLLRSRPHVLHLHWLHPFYESAAGRRSQLRLRFSLLGLWMLRRLGVRLVWTAHNIGHHEAKGSSVDRACTRFIARRADAIIVHGESAKRRVVEELRLPDPNRVFVIPHGHYIDSYKNDVNQRAARARLGLPDSSVVLLFFGQIRPYKGVLELIEAFRRCDSTDARLVIAGRPLSEADAETVRRAASGNPSVSLVMDFVSDDDIQVYMKACDAVVLPYRDILTSGAGVLAMSFARACVVPRLGCFTDLLDERGAVFYDAEKLDGLEMGLNEAVSRRGELVDLGAHNLESAGRWDWSSVARRTLEVYRFALGLRGANDM